jgi:hypothetical protein
MRKIFLVLVVSFVLVLYGNAQQPSFNKGSKVIDLSVGLPNLHGYGMVIPPIIGSFEIGIVDGIFDKAAVGIGGYVGISDSKLLNHNYFNTHFGVKGAFHYPFVDKLDTYAGIVTGYSISDLSGYGFDWGAFVGIRYYFTRSMAVMAEAGYEVTFLKVGMSFKF